LLGGDGVTVDKYKQALFENAGGVRDLALMGAPNAVNTAVSAYKVRNSPDQADTFASEAIEALPGGQILADVIDSVPTLKEKRQQMIDAAKRNGHDYVSSAGQSFRALNHSMSDDEIRMLMMTRD
jgi:hypothetical protein